MRNNGNKEQRSVLTQELKTNCCKAVTSNIGVWHSPKQAKTAEVKVEAFKSTGRALPFFMKICKGKIKKINLLVTKWCPDPGSYQAQQI